MAKERKMKYSAHHDPIHDQVSVVTLSFYLFICLLRQLDETRRPSSSFSFKSLFSKKFSFSVLLDFLSNVQVFYDALLIGRLRLLSRKQGKSAGKKDNFLENVVFKRELNYFCCFCSVFTWIMKSDRD